MKKLKKLLILLAVLVVLVGAYFAVTLLTKDPEPIDIAEIAIFTAQPEELQSLSWDCDSGSVTLNRAADGAWSVDGQPDFPLDQNFPKIMSSKLQSLVALSTLTEFDPSPATYGLDAPALTLRVTKTDGSVTTFTVGLLSSAVGGYYLQTDRDPAQLHIVPEDFFTAFHYGLYDLIVKEKLPTMPSLVGLDVQSGSNEFRVYYSDSPTGGISYTDEYSWFLACPAQTDGVDTPASINKIVELVTPVANLSWQKCVAYQATEQELAAYGLDEAGASRVTMTYLDDMGSEQSVTLLFGAYEDASCYARLADSAMVYLVDAAAVDPLLTANAATVAPDDVCLMNWDSVLSMDVTLDGSTYTVAFEGSQKTTSIDGESKEQNVYTCNGQNLDSTAMEALLESLHAMKASETVTESASGRGQAISFTFHRNPEEVYSEMTLTFYQYNSANYLVTFTGQPTRLVDSATVSTMLTHAKTVFSAA